MNYLYNSNYLNEYLGTSDTATFNSTTVEPPKAVQNRIWCFNKESSAWDSNVADYRGSTIYGVDNSLDTRIVKKIGELPAGYTLVTPPDFESMYKYVDNAWVLFTPVIPETVYTYSKLKILRALKEAGIWVSVKQSIEQADAYEEWLVAQDLASNDPLFVQMYTLIKSQYPTIDIDSILAQCLIEN